jgi:hypothetical protein
VSIKKHRCERTQPDNEFRDLIRNLRDIIENLYANKRTRYDLIVDSAEKGHAAIWAYPCQAGSIQKSPLLSFAKHS